jgi:hypothetical protein
MGILSVKTLITVNLMEVKDSSPQFFGFNTYKDTGFEWL